MMTQSAAGTEDPEPEPITTPSDTDTGTNKVRPVTREGAEQELRNNKPHFQMVSGTRLVGYLR